MNKLYLYNYMNMNLRPPSLVYLDTDHINYYYTTIIMQTKFYTICLYIIIGIDIGNQPQAYSSCNTTPLKIDIIILLYTFVYMQELLPEETASFWYISFGWSQQIEQENTNELIRLIITSKH